MDADAALYTDFVHFVKSWLSIQSRKDLTPTEASTLWPDPLVRQRTELRLALLGNYTKLILRLVIWCKHCMCRVDIKTLFLNIYRAWEILGDILYCIFYKCVTVAVTWTFRNALLTIREKKWNVWRCFCFGYFGYNVHQQAFLDE